jgi:hypothetical protein
MQCVNVELEADISIAVIHDRARRCAPARRSEVVNNCDTDISFQVDVSAIGAGSASSSRSHAYAAGIR